MSINFHPTNIFYILPTFYIFVTQSDKIKIRHLGFLFCNWSVYLEFNKLKKCEVI
jgi:hypothetical protein